MIGAISLRYTVFQVVNQSPDHDTPMIQHYNSLLTLIALSSFPQFDHDILRQ